MNEFINNKETSMTSPIQLETFSTKKHLLRMSERDLQIFAFKNELIDGIKYTFVETGQRFCISKTRVEQIVAKIEDRLEKATDIIF